MPSLPNPIRFRPVTQHKDRSITQTVNHPLQNGVSHDKQYDPVTGLMNPSDFEQSSFTNSSSVNYEQQRENIPPIQQATSHNIVRMINY
jgi:hypothetical protein